ncbi:hypothetical protein [Rhizobium sp.]|uniref:hypothetical protein n=1 Tax=Rhizobium sp. TaxID=391 RepID=UPI0028AA9722
MTAPKQPMRVVIPLDSQAKTSWDHALAYAKKIADSSQGQIKKIVLLTHTKSQITGTALGSHIGSTAAKTLNSGGVIALGGGVALSYQTMRTMPMILRDTVIITFFAEPKMLDYVDGLMPVSGVVVVPDLAGGADSWIARWNPIVHGVAPSQPTTLIADKTVEAALENISSMINLSHGALNPRDKGYADEILRILRAKGHSIDAAQAKSWAIRRGWKVSAADELAALAVKIWAMKSKPSLTKFHNPEGRYNRWRGE